MQDSITPERVASRGEAIHQVFWGVQHDNYEHVAQHLRHYEHLAFKRGLEKGHLLGFSVGLTVGATIGTLTAAIIFLLYL